jgi:integrase
MSPIELGQAAEYLRNKWRSYLRYDIHNGASDRNYFSLNRARQLERARFRQADAVAKAADDLLHSLRTATRSLDQIAEVVFPRVNDVCYLIGRTVIILCLLHRVFAEWAAHDFCRIFTTDAILNGMPPHIAQILLGHADINTTMGR